MRGIAREKVSRARGYPEDFQEQCYPNVSPAASNNYHPIAPSTLWTGIIHSNIVFGFKEMKGVSEVGPDRLPRKRTADRAERVRTGSYGESRQRANTGWYAPPDSMETVRQGWEETFYRRWDGDSQYFLWVWWFLQPGGLVTSVTFPSIWKVSLLSSSSLLLLLSPPPFFFFFFKRN